MSTATEVLWILVKASRPVGWSFGPILYAIGLVHSPKLNLRKAAVAIQLAALSAPLALVVFGVNDVYDHATDIRNSRKTADGLEGTVLDPSYHPQVLLSAWLATASILLSSLLVRRLPNTAITIALLVLCWEYSAPPFRFKERPLLDSLSNGAIIDLCYLIGYTAGGGALDSRMLRLKGHILGLCTAAVHALGAVVDLDADAAVNQLTIATVFGARPAVGLAAANYLFALLIERDLTIFGIYLIGGLLVMLVPLFEISYAHLAFRTIVYWTGGMSAVWFADKGIRVLRRKQVEHRKLR